MDDREKLYKLLYYAFLEIRDSSRASGDKASYYVADLLHVTVAELGQAAAGMRTYPEVFDSLRKRAETKGCEGWIDDRIRQMEENQARKTGQV